MPPDSYVDWGAVHFYTPLNRTGEQILTDEEKSKGCPVSDTLVVSEGFVGVKMRAILGNHNPTLNVGFAERPYKGHYSSST